MVPQDFFLSCFSFTLINLFLKHVCILLYPDYTSRVYIMARKLAMTGTWVIRNMFFAQRILGQNSFTNFVPRAS